jgi:hypothetical protein
VKRLVHCLTLAALVAAPLSAQGNPGDPVRQVTGGGVLPAGWSANAGAPENLINLKFVTMPPGWHVTTGPTTNLWREEDKTTGKFHLLATLIRTQAPAHPEAYGLIIAGKDMNTATPSYTYFLVRGDGKFMINRMEAGKRTILVNWTDHPAVTRAGGSGESSDMLEVDGKSQGTKLIFRVNGKSVHEIDAGSLNLDGVVGLRISHNLDVHVKDFAIHKL